MEHGAKYTAPDRMTVLHILRVDSVGYADIITIYSIYPGPHSFQLRMWVVASPTPPQTRTLGDSCVLYSLNRGTKTTSRMSRTNMRAPAAKKDYDLSKGHNKSAKVNKKI